MNTILINLVGEQALHMLPEISGDFTPIAPDWGKMELRVIGRDMLDRLLAIEPLNMLTAVRILFQEGDSTQLKLVLMFQAAFLLRDITPLLRMRAVNGGMVDIDLGELFPDAVDWAHTQEILQITQARTAVVGLPY